MAPRRPASLLAALTIVLLPALAMAQAPSAKGPSKGKTVAPRTPDGKPDLQGFWDFRTLTPLERPANQPNKTFLTEEEAGSVQKQTAERRARAAAPSEAPTPRAPGGGARAVGGYNDFWLDFGNSVVGDRRTSLIVDPDGWTRAAAPEGRAASIRLAPGGHAAPTSACAC